jgi:hypothetical protein
MVPQRAVVAVLHVAQHPPEQAHVGEMRQPPLAAVALVKDVLRLDVQAELRGGADAFRDGRIKSVQAIEQQDLVRLQLHRLWSRSAGLP